MSKLEQIAQAIAKMEGFGAPGKPNIPTRLNNPGDLMFAHQVGATPHDVKGTDGKVRTYAAFATPEAGFYALRAQIRLDASRRLTLRAFIHKYAPASDNNDPASYLAFVMRAIGVTDADTKLASLIADA